MAICNTVVVSRKDHGCENGDCRKLEERTLDVNSSPDANHTAFDGRTDRSTAHLLANSTQPSELSANGNIQGLCNSALTRSPVKHIHQPKNDQIVDDIGIDSNGFIYEAESPDEAALVKAACRYGYRLISRSPDSVTVYVPSEGEVTFEILHILAFDSTRKRMSVVVRHPTSGSILLYCKGADSAIMSHLTALSYTASSVDSLDTPDAEPRNLVEMTEAHLNGYAKDGLRTLCMARKVCIIN